MSTIIPFPDRSAILIDRASDGLFTVEPFLCPRACEKGRAFTHACDALDYAEALAREAGTGYFLMCDP